ncbi:Deoxyuridine 5'-triphosphate nucleotidohydrolase [Gossypium arboreum]|uniref:Deoxyuridine 5'-triphosphate nucleotidohydrolase n=1 Tax=Gossypium arboreum TaxID=29729 RepID=A0A0B0NDG9_GOSAR|nr:Deoxyuridine 5'-triphosphate nucleotidohydrolase [Gossypium arboreum]
MPTISKTKAERCYNIKTEVSETMPERCYGITTPRNKFWRSIKENEGFQSNRNAKPTQIPAWTGNPAVRCEVHGSAYLRRSLL